MQTINVNGVTYAPVRKHHIIIPGYYVSRCAKVWNDITKRNIKPYENYRNSKAVDKKPKCYDFSMTTDGTPFWNLGFDYKEKKGAPGKVEFRMKLHIAVIDAWRPWKEEINGFTHEECKKLLEEMMCVDHVDDDVSNNHLDNLQYSTPFQNSNVIKEWFKNKQKLYRERNYEHLKQLRRRQMYSRVDKG